ncbi:MAG: phenylalanine--tRNA ligase subunit beta [Brevinematales bacterium]
MKVTYNWLKEFVPIDIPVEELSQRLTGVGPEVTGIKKIGISPDNINNIFLAKISDIQPHPQSGSLKIATASAGRNTYNLISNSKALEKGVYVVIAVPGTVLPGGAVIQEAVIKGEKSEGMILAREHLCLEEKSQDIWILGKDEKKARSFFEIYTEEDYLLEIELTSNRSDCLSVIGIAREIAAMLDKELHIPSPSAYETTEEIPDITIEEKNLCPRYSARVLRGIRVDESPEWLKRKLELCGIRAINNIVDATNYVLLETGHPMHAFDIARLEEGRIVVRKAEAGEKIRTLDGLPREIDERMLVIADGKKPVAIAGIMGGENSHVIQDSADILLESAYFDPVSIRRTAKKLGLRTEASYRFERTADWGITVSAIERATEIIMMTCTPAVSRVRDEYVNIFKDKIINVKADYVSSKLGIKMPLRTIESILKRLRFTILAKREDALEVKVPTFRSDVSRVIDIVEEAARIHGYNNIPQNMFRPPIDIEGLRGRKDEELFLRENLRGQGFTESYNFSFTNENETAFFKTGEENLLKLQNPLSGDATLMRNYLFPGLLKTIEYNAKSAYIEEARFYEIGRTFHRKKNNFTETRKAGFVMFGSGYDYYSVTGILEYLILKTGVKKIDYKRITLPFLHPVNSAEIYALDKAIGFAGEVHPDIALKLDLRFPAYICEIDTSRLKELLDLETDLKDISRFPPTGRDISIIVNDDLLSRGLMLEIEGFHEWIRNVKYTDLFKGKQIGENKKSVTFSILFQSSEKTLTDDEVNNVMTKLIGMLKEKYGALIRE